MPKKTSKVKEADAIQAVSQAISALKAYRFDAADRKQAHDALRTISSYVRQQERAVSATRRQLKDQGIDARREMKRILKGE